MGAPTGERHPKAKLTSDQVREIREIYERWKAVGAWKGYGTLAIIFECSPWTIRDICTYRTRYAE